LLEFRSKAGQASQPQAGKSNQLEIDGGCHCWLRFANDLPHQAECQGDNRQCARDGVGRTFVADPDAGGEECSHRRDDAAQIVGPPRAEFL
jgi:hypothetical protein